MVTEDTRAAFARRLNALLDRRGFVPKNAGRQLKLAEIMGVSQKGARKWLEGESLPTTARIMELAGRFFTTFEWLASGDDLDPPDIRIPAFTWTEQASQADTTSGGFGEVGALWNQLTKTQKDEVAETMRRMAQENDKVLAELLARQGATTPAIPTETGTFAGKPKRKDPHDGADLVSTRKDHS